MMSPDRFLLDKQGKPIIIRRAQALVLELADRHG
jgi:hypothetical protein